VWRGHSVVGVARSARRIEDWEVILGVVNATPCGRAGAQFVGQPDELAQPVGKPRRASGAAEIRNSRVVRCGHVMDQFTENLLRQLHANNSPFGGTEGPTWLGRSPVITPLGVPVGGEIPLSARERRRRRLPAKCLQIMGINERGALTNDAATGRKSRTFCCGRCTLSVGGLRDVPTVAAHLASILRAP
jgi:hypothetical protein